MDNEKFKTLVHYVCWRCQDPSKLGAVKLNKILWLSDFMAYYETGTPITGSRYVKQAYGPVPAGIRRVLDELQRDGAIRVSESDFHGYTKKEFQTLRDPDTRLLTEQELKITNDNIAFVCEQHTARTISELSHDQVWQAAADGEDLPYFTIFATPGKILEDEREWATIQIEEQGL